MGVKSVIIGIVSSMLLIGCGTPCKCLVCVGGVEVKDSVSVREIVSYRDSVIYFHVPVESRTEVTDSDTSVVSTSLAESMAYMKDGMIHHSIWNRQDAIVPINVTIPFRVQSTDSTKRLVVTNTVQVEKELTSWQLLFLKTGKTVIFGLIALALVGLVAIIVKVLKMTRK